MKEKDDEEFIFPHEKKENGYITYNHVRKHLDSLVKDAGLNILAFRINPHSIRHLYARKFNKLYKNKKILLSNLIGHANF